MNTKEPRKALGRGISSLIPTPKTTSTPEVVVTSGVDTSASDTFRTSEKSLFVEMDRIRMNPRQPRKVFSEGALAELTQSIQEKGILQPLLVCRKGLHYELIAGERRYRAAKSAGLSLVPVRVLDTSDQEQLEIALIENLMREDLNAIEEARGYERLQKEFNLTHDQISQKVSKDRTTITNALRLLKLPLVIQQEVQRGNLSMGHARALLSLEKENLQLKLAQEILSKGLSVRQTESLANQWISPKKTSTQIKKENPNLQHLREEIQRKLGTKVEIKEKSPQKGEIRILYFNQTDLHRILELFKNLP